MVEGVYKHGKQKALLIMQLGEIRRCFLIYKYLQRY